MSKKISSIKPLNKDNYLTVIKNACGSKMWANAYCLVNGKKKDVLRDGDVSCAFFVSSILKLFDAIKRLHFTVQGTEKDLKESGWQRIPISIKMPKGSVLVWEKQSSSNKKNTEEHYHVGFYLGEEKAVSTWAYNNFPVIHHYLNCGKTRKIIRAYWNPKIKN
jgi:hypothetical protein